MSRRRFVAGIFLAGLCVVVLLPQATSGQAAVVTLLQEGFEDGSFASRGWYDGSSSVLSTAEKYAGTRSLECRFAAGGTSCPTPSRHLFQETDSVYISYYIKHSTNWVGSGVGYHPHIFYFLTNLNDQYSGLAYTHLTAYVEENSGRATVGIQDGMNIDESRIGQNLTNVTEQRSVAGCNGDSDGHGDGACYSATSTTHWNGKLWYSNSVIYNNTAGSSNYKGEWHLVEAYIKLNSIVSGKGAKDGVIRYWHDGNLVLDQTNVVIRTGARPTMKFNQLIIGPWIGDGSPVAQTFWVDNLIVATGRPATPPTPPGGAAPVAPAPPTNLRIVS